MYAKCAVKHEWLNTRGFYLPSPLHDNDKGKPQAHKD